MEFGHFYSKELFGEFADIVVVSMDLTKIIFFRKYILEYRKYYKEINFPRSNWWKDKSPNYILKQADSPKTSATKQDFPVQKFLQTLPEMGLPGTVWNKW